MHIIRILINSNKGRSSNAYLIRSDPITLIDTGFVAPGTYEAFFEAFDHLGLKISDLGRIIITHGHVDH